MPRINRGGRSVKIFWSIAPCGFDSRPRHQFSCLAPYGRHSVPEGCVNEPCGIDNDYVLGIDERALFPDENTDNKIGGRKIH